MLMLIIPSAVGLFAGLMLLRTAPTLQRTGRQPGAELPLSIVIPARNEAENLPGLLDSLSDAGDAMEVIVVDDESSDGTAAIARQHRAKVFRSQPLPVGWLGKPWACWQGAEMAQNDTVLFLDADTHFVAGGLQCLRDCFAALPADSAVSILPFHRMKCWYEQLSLFFNLLMAMGAGGFGGIDSPHMFGQCMMVSTGLYARSGGHAAVHCERLENMRLAEYFRKSSGNIHAFSGVGVLEMRLFPEGFAQLHASWKRSAANGAGASSTQVLVLAYIFLSGCAYAPLCVLLSADRLRLAALAIFFTYAALLAFQSRQLGTYRMLTALLYPVPMLFYFAVLAEAALGRLRGKKASWRGREL